MAFGQQFRMRNIMKANEGDYPLPVLIPASGRIAFIEQLLTVLLK